MKIFLLIVCISLLLKNSDKVKNKKYVKITGAFLSFALLLELILWLE